MRSLSFTDDNILVVYGLATDYGDGCTIFSLCGVLLELQIKLDLLHSTHLVKGGIRDGAHDRDGATIAIRQRPRPLQFLVTSLTLDVFG